MSVATNPEIKKFIDDCSEDWDDQLDITEVNQKEVFTKNGTPLYMLPSYGWDGGNGFSITMHNLQSFEHIDVMGGPGAGLYRKVDATKPAAAFYKCSGVDMAEVLVFP